MSEIERKVRKVSKVLNTSRARLLIDTNDAISRENDSLTHISEHVKIPEIDAYWCIYLRPQKQAETKQDGRIWTLEFFINNEEIIKSNSYKVQFEVFNGIAYNNSLLSVKQINSRHIVGIKSNFISNLAKTTYTFGINVTIFYDENIRLIPLPRNWILNPSKIGELLDSSEFSDFSYKVKDKEFKVHKNILSLASPVFMNTFTCGLDETKSNIAVVHDCDPELFQHLLAFIYKDAVPENLSEVVFDLYELAHIYQISSLLEICYCHLINIELNEENVFELYEYAKKFDLKELHSNCWTFIKIKMLKIYTPLNRDPYTVQEIREILEAENELSETQKKVKELREKIAEKGDLSLPSKNTDIVRIDDVILHTP